MKIQSIETYSTKEISIVRVVTDNGEEGYGQIAPYHANISSLVLHQQIAQHVLGQDPMDIDGIVDRCIEAEHKFPGSYICRAVGGVDTALWDLKGKLEGKSVCELLGGEIRPIQAYGSSMRRDITPQDEADRLKLLKQKDGYRAFKIRIGNNFGKNVDVWPGRTEEIVPTVRQAIGEDIALLVDANSGYTPDRAIEVGKMLEQYNVGHFEEPCPYPEIEWTAEVTRALTIPVAGGEQDNCLAQWRRLIDLKAVDIVQPDVCYLGGLSRTLRVAKMAAEAGLPCTPHAANLSMVTVFTLHLLGALKNAGPYLEFSIEKTPWTENLFYPVLEVKDGMVEIPKKPGWGVGINEDWLKKADYKISQLN
ncbi:L-alanine-DL-glutamate epimerase-like enolase superfamily enzyme [Evansella vedderi]|uniref:L-alanine-DL-glutamate epimerase-like enolase superfamily enzyme n=1 Tax=Evansella vedderi TaxID=38282 RepID=A0ABT9ZQ03_9BACI|nr:mandelate racemase/muconate lactonizing enzyme family protein [Evansella vedderi]MDQ0253319.1 L-alanine-DL-glutamate epimerase-like enolase superfamily enzyme [Evansella vedderi]